MVPISQVYVDGEVDVLAYEGKVPLVRVPQVRSYLISPHLASSRPISPPSPLISPHLPHLPSSQLAKLLAPLLRKRRGGRAADVPGAEVGALSSTDGSASDDCEGFKFLLELKLADRTLATSLMHDRIGGSDFVQVVVGTGGDEKGSDGRNRWRPGLLLNHIGWWMLASSRLPADCLPIASRLPADYERLIEAMRHAGS